MLNKFNKPIRVAIYASIALTMSFSHLFASSSISIGMQQEPTSLDPTSDATASIDGMLSHNVYESLTTVNESGQVLPALATDWQVSPDGLEYTFNLRKNVKYHDGSAFDSEDVLFSFERAMSEDSVNPTKKIFKPIEEISAPDSHSVVIKLKKKDAFFLFNMAKGDASIVASESSASNNEKPVGTGPFIFDDWKRGDRLVLVKNSNWHDAQSVSLEKVEFRFISDAAAATAAMMAEELDAFPGFPAPELLEQFEADPRFTVTIGSTEGEVILAFNNKKSPFDNLDVRRALSHAINRDEVIDGAMYGRAVPIGSFYPPHGAAYVDLTNVYAHDLNKSKELLKASGLKIDELSLRVPPFPYATRSAEIIQAQFSKVGIDVKVENVEWGFWIDEVYKKKNYDMTIIAHTSPNDLGNFARGPKYFYGFDDPAYNDLYAQIVGEADPEKRSELVKQAQRYLTDKAVHGFLFQLPKLGIFKNGIKGFWKSAPVLYQPLQAVSVK